ncbi:MAG TPA: hypothetical protein VLQ45_06540 [Thermoanaerobaculia bacterium]|nr:hypothetical protein [Thermoanaerobaculia bacterium]
MRRSLILFLLLQLFLACRTSRPEAAMAAGVSVEPVQKVAYRVPDAAKDRTESWLFDVRIREAQGRDAEPVGARVELLSAQGEVLKTTELGPVGVKAITVSAPRPLSTKVNPALHGIRFKFTKPAGFPVDKVRCRIDLALYTMPDGMVADTGNSVVIDHQNGELSLVAHMQRATGFLNTRGTSHAHSISQGRA